MSAANHPPPRTPPARGGAEGFTLALPALGFWLGRQGGTSSPVVFHRLTYRTGVVQGARLSPDGRSVVGAARSLRIGRRFYRS